MFTWLNKRGVRSSEGFEVQFTGRFTSEYREQSNIITIEFEPGKLSNGKYCVIVESKNFAKWDDGTPISEAKQAQIIKNFIAGVEFQNLAVEVDGYE